VYEYADLKTALTLIAQGETSTKPFFTPLGRYGNVHFEAWPDVKAMLAGTEFESYLKQYLDRSSTGTLRSEHEGIRLETALDRHYYVKLWNGLKMSNCGTA